MVVGRLRDRIDKALSHPLPLGEVPSAHTGWRGCIVRWGRDGFVHYDKKEEKSPKIPLYFCKMFHYNEVKLGYWNHHSIEGAFFHWVALSVSFADSSPRGGARGALPVADTATRASGRGRWARQPLRRQREHRAPQQESAFGAEVDWGADSRGRLSLRVLSFSIMHLRPLRHRL